MSECSHEWYFTSVCTYDVEGCIGVICSKCGKLSCACEKDVSKIGPSSKGDKFFNKFYKDVNEYPTYSVVE